MNIQLIVADLDNTLLNDEKKVSDYTFAVLEKCRNAGIKVIFATGRGQSALKIVPLDQVDGYVRDNGALAYADGHLCYKRLIRFDAIRDFIVAAQENGLQFFLKSNGTRYTNFSADNVVLVDYATLDMEMEEFYMPYISDADFEYVKAHIPSGLHVFLSRKNWLMITNGEAQKPLAIAAVADYWGIPAENIVVFGDDTNDISMFAYAGVRVAMDNAIDEVKSVADYVCGDNNSDGVARWIEENILSV